jgi:hypothetical protein
MVVISKRPEKIPCSRKRLAGGSAVTGGSGGVSFCRRGLLAWDRNDRGGGIELGLILGASGGIDATGDMILNIHGREEYVNQRSDTIVEVDPSLKT